MARISTYTKDTQINKEDIIIGSDGAEGAGLATKNFTVESLTAYMQGNLTDIEVVGLQGPQGDPGPKGDPGEVGPAGLNWQGAWVSGNNYVEDDAVGYDGASYFCIADATGETTAPSADTTHWALLAAQGAKGDNGDRGPRGYGISGASGSYYNDLGNPIVTPTDDSEYKVTLTFEDGTTLTTDDIRGAQGSISTAGTVTSVGVDAATPLSIAGSGPNPITESGTITISAADTDTDGYITSTDWDTFNDKQDALTFGDLTEANSSILSFNGNTNAIIGSGTTIEVSQSSTNTSGYLSSTDWNTFNDKIEGTATTGNTAPTEIRVMTEAEYSAPGFTPANDVIYVLV